VCVYVYIYMYIDISIYMCIWKGECVHLATVCVMW